MRKKSGVGNGEGSVGNGESGVGNGEGSVCNQSGSFSVAHIQAMQRYGKRNVPPVGTKRPTRWDKAHPYLCGEGKILSTPYIHRYIHRLFH